MANALDSSDGGDDAAQAAQFSDDRAAAERVGAASADGPLTHARFVALIDRCVRHIAAEFRAEPAGPDRAAAQAANAARIQLWRWLHDGGATLDDGTPIGFSLFDSALQRSSERLPRRGARAQQHVTRAAWLLAELTHAPTLAPASGAIAPACLADAAPLPRYPTDAATD